MVYVQIMDGVNQEKKDAMAGQVTLFDFADEEAKETYKVQMPDVGEYDTDQKLEFEKEVIGIYASGHPLQDQEEKWRRVITNMTLDFAVPEEGEESKVEDKSHVTVGGIVSTVTRKFTKTGVQMAFITLEDLVGTIEVIVFPRQYDSNRHLIVEGKKVFIDGEANIEENAAGKVIANKIREFSDVPSELWVAFADKGDYLQKNQEFIQILSENRGNDKVMVALAKERQRKMMPAQYSVSITNELLELLKKKYGEEFVKVRA